MTAYKVDVKSIKAIADRNINALKAAQEKGQSALNAMYFDGQKIVKGICKSGTKDTEAREAQGRAAALYSKYIFESGLTAAKSAETIAAYIFKLLADSDYVRAIAVKSVDDVELAKKASEAKRAKFNRAVSAEKKALVEKDKKAGIKVTEERALELLEVAKEHVTEATKANKATIAEKEKQQRNNVRALTMVDKISALVANDACGDGDTKQLLAAFVSVKSLIKELL